MKQPAAQSLSFINSLSAAALGVRVGLGLDLGVGQKPKQARMWYAEHVPATFSSICWSFFVVVVVIWRHAFKNTHCVWLGSDLPRPPSAPLMKLKVKCKFVAEILLGVNWYDSRQPTTAQLAGKSIHLSCAWPCIIINIIISMLFYLFFFGFNFVHLGLRSLGI